MSQNCIVDDDCSYFWECHSGICEHKPLWPPNPVEVIALLLIPIVIGLGNVGGAGGGVVKVPLMMMMMNYDQRTSTYMAYCIQFGACITNIALILQQRHPNKDKPIIDYQMATIISPAVMIGTTLGIYANIFLPELANTILFIVFLMCIAPYLYKKGIKLKGEENKAKKEDEDFKGSQMSSSSEVNDGIDPQDKALEEEILRSNSNFFVAQQTTSKSRKNSEQRAMSIEALRYKEGSGEHHDFGHFQQGQLKRSNEQNQELDQRLLDTIPESNHYDSTQSDDFLQGVQISDALAEIYRIEEKKIPLKKFGIIFALFLVTQLVSFLQGTKKLKSIIAIENCSTAYWLITACLPIIIILFTYYAYVTVLKEEELKEKIGYDFDKDDVRINKKSFFTIWGYGFTAGFLAGALGAGGGISLVTFLLALGTQSRVASATTGLNNFWIGLTSLIAVLTNQTLNYVEIIVFIGAAFIGGLVVAKLIYAYVQKTKKQSMIIFVVFGLVLINFICNFVYIFKQGYSKSAGWDSLLTTKEFC